MSKRFFETGIWSKPWFRTLDPACKVAWFYILTNCDNVGVWDADKALAEFCVGCPVEWDTLISACNGNLEVLPNGKWWLIDYCRFQHGDLFSQKRSVVLDSYLLLLEKHGLTERVRQQFGNCLETVQGVGLGKGEGRGKEGESEREYAKGVSLSPSAFRDLCDKYGDRLVTLAIEKVSAQQIKTGKPYKHPHGAILQWGIRAAEEDIKKHGAPKAARATSPRCSCGAPVWSGSEHGRCMDCERKAVMGEATPKEAGEPTEVDDPPGAVVDPDDIF